MKLGLFGGTFDPIHLGHLSAAEVAREELALDEVVFVPVRTPPHRSELATSALDRYAMVALATAGHPCFLASDLELRRDGPSYTVETLATLHGERPGDAIVLIVGSDTYPEMESWREHDRVFALCEVAVVARPGGPRSAVRPSDGRRVRTLRGEGLPVSASDVRQRLREGRSIRYLVPEAVADYIAKRGLYR